MSTANTVYMAIVQHNNWKHRLKDIIDTGVIDKSYDPSPEHCQFGKWLEEYRGSLEMFEKYHDVVQLHKKFHEEADRIVKLSIVSGKAVAHAAMDYGSTFDHISQALVKAIIDWHDEIIAKK